jgi:hypothetical protein
VVSRIELRAHISESERGESEKGVVGDSESERNDERRKELEEKTRKSEWSDEEFVK